jgi:hypothetical protein
MSYMRSLEAVIAFYPPSCADPVGIAPDCAHLQTEPEPLPDGHALFSLPNVILTPHSSWTSTKNFVRACDLVEENARRCASGEPVLNVLRSKGQ